MHPVHVPVTLRLAVAVQARAATWRAAPQRGQATIEYIGILLLVGALMAAVVKLSPSLGTSVKDAVSGAFDDAFKAMKSGRGGA